MNTSEDKNSIFSFDFGESVNNDKPDEKYYTMSEYINFIISVEKDNLSIANNIDLMLTKFRKIYYDSLGWNEILIPETGKITTFPPSKDIQKLQHSHHVVLSNNDLYDVAHIFAILDANNHNGPFTPVPDSIVESDYWKDIKNIVPVVEDRLMASGWLGDLSEITGEFYLKINVLLSKKEKHKQKQKIINTFGAYNKTLANIDGMILANNGQGNTGSDKKVSDMFLNYYGTDFQSGVREELKSSIYLRFSELIGLEGWDGNTFKNKKNWLSFQKSNLRTCTAFYVIKTKGLNIDITQSDLENIKEDLKYLMKKLESNDKVNNFVSQALNSINDKNLRESKIPTTLIICFLIWTGAYDSILSLDSVLESYLDGLSQAIIKTQK